MTLKKRASIFLATMLLLTIIAELIPTEILAQQEMTPEWTYESGDKFSVVAISADGNYIGAGNNSTKRFHLFRGGQSLWNYSVGNIHSISMSSDGKYIAVGAESNFFLFNRESSSPLLEYKVDYETSMVAISSDGKYAIVGARPSTYLQSAESKLHMFNTQQSTPRWTKTLPGILESLSMSSNGDYSVASTSLPGKMYVFAKEQETPLWNYSFGDWSGAEKISSNGDYVVATGGDKVFASDPTRERRIFQFTRQSSTPIYQKSIPELPTPSGLSLSLNGSIFAISYENKTELMLFNKNIQPYGPNSIRTASLLAPRVSMTMSLDGRYIFVGTTEGLSVYEYRSNSLSLKQQYTMNNPTIFGIASSSDGEYAVAIGHWGLPNNGHSFMYFFENLRETSDTANPWAQWSPLMIGIVIVAAGTTGYVFYRRKTFRSSLHTLTETKLLGNYNEST